MATILVVDDEPDVVQILGFCLKRDGHTVFTAANGEGALAATAQYRPDLILLDVMMPHMDGFTVLRHLRQHQEPSLAKTPVVMLTAKSDFGSMAEAWGMDVDDYVIKPFRPEDLTKTVRNVLSVRGKLPPAE